MTTPLARRLAIALVASLAVNLFLGGMATSRWLFHAPPGAHGAGPTASDTSTGAPHMRRWTRARAGGSRPSGATASTTFDRASAPRARRVTTSCAS